MLLGVLLLVCPSLGVNRKVVLAVKAAVKNGGSYVSIPRGRAKPWPGQHVDNNDNMVTRPRSRQGARACKANDTH